MRMPNRSPQDHEAQKAEARRDENQMASDALQLLIERAEAQGAKIPTLGHLGSVVD